MRTAAGRGRAQRKKIFELKNGDGFGLGEQPEGAVMGRRQAASRVCWAWVSNIARRRRGVNRSIRCKRVLWDYETVMVRGTASRARTKVCSLELIISGRAPGRGPEVAQAVTTSRARDGTKNNRGLLARRTGQEVHTSSRIFRLIIENIPFLEIQQYRSSKDTIEKLLNIIVLLYFRARV